MKEFFWGIRSHPGMSYIGVGGVTFQFKKLLWLTIIYKIKFRLVSLDKGGSHSALCWPPQPWEHIASLAWPWRWPSTLLLVLKTLLKTSLKQHAWQNFTAFCTQFRYSPVHSILFSHQFLPSFVAWLGIETTSYPSEAGARGLAVLNQWVTGDVWGWFLLLRNEGKEANGWLRNLLEDLVERSHCCLTKNHAQPRGT